MICATRNPRCLSPVPRRTCEDHTAPLRLHHFACCSFREHKDFHLKLSKRQHVEVLYRKRHTRVWVLKACEARLGPGFCNPGHPEQWRRDLQGCIPASAGSAWSRRRPISTPTLPSWTKNSCLGEAEVNLGECAGVGGCDALGVILRLLRVYERCCRRFREVGFSVSVGEAMF